MAFSFDPIFAADPSNAQNVASNAAITLWDPADPTHAPVTITDLTGSPLPNPITVNKNGFGPAFMHATLDRLGWSGAGFSNFFTSYEGMKNVAIAAQAAAEAAGADAAAAASAGVASVAVAADAAAAAAAASATAAANSAALVAAPADSAIAAAITGTGTETKAALSATYATRASAPFTINSTDSNGNPTSITYHVAGGDVTTTYTYGANGVATETTAGQTITYTYDGSGNLTGAV